MKIWGRKTIVCVDSVMPVDKRGRVTKQVKLGTWGSGKDDSLLLYG
jgi:hypothetical protein